MKLIILTLTPATLDSPEPGDVSFQIRNPDGDVLFHRLIIGGLTVSVVNEEQTKTVSYVIP